MLLHLEYWPNFQLLPRTAPLILLLLSRRQTDRHSLHSLASRFTRTHKTTAFSAVPPSYHQTTTTTCVFKCAITICRPLKRRIHQQEAHENKLFYFLFWEAQETHTHCTYSLISGWFLDAAALAKHCPSGVTRRWQYWTIRIRDTKTHSGDIPGLLCLLHSLSHNTWPHWLQRRRLTLEIYKDTV